MAVTTEPSFYAVTAKGRRVRLKVIDAAQGLVEFPRTGTYTRLEIVFPRGRAIKFLDLDDPTDRRGGQQTMTR